MNRSYESYTTGGIEKKFRNLENRITEDVVRRVKKTKTITSSADYQLNRYYILGNSTQDIENIIKSAVGDDFPETWELYDEVVEKQYTRSKYLFEQVNQKFIPYEQNSELQQIVDTLIRQSNEELFNITKSMGFMVDMGGKKVFTPLSEYYNEYLDNAMVEITSGAFDYNSVIRRVVGQMTNSGLRTVEYASGRTARCDVAARRAIMTGLSQLSGHISDTNAQRLGTEYFEIDWHSGARPEHRAWQGKVWSREQLTTVCGYGTVTGLLGANCYHEYYPFLPGISERNYTDSWLEEQNRKEDKPRTFKGREYTLYEATQRQRYLETNMRAQRQKVLLLKEAEADADTIMLVRCKYQAQLDEYKAFSKKMGLPEQRERIYYDLQGRVAPSRGIYQKWQDEKKRNADRREERKEQQEKSLKVSSSSQVKREALERPILSKDEIIEQAKIYGAELEKNISLLRYDNGYPISNYLNEKLGYDEKPRIVSAQEFERLKEKGKTVLYRGVTDYKEITAHDMAEQFKHGKFYCGRGIYGYGTYTDTNKAVANYYAYDSGITQNGEVMEMILMDDAKVVDYLEIFKEYEKTGIPQIVGEKPESYQDVLDNVGAYASIKGYDAISLNGFQNKNHVVILNRGKVVVKE
ncbi:MAG: phage minor capsid protein [Lachnospiraceae bacterium]|jgi:hypothetical protein